MGEVNELFDGFSAVLERAQEFDAEYNKELAFLDTLDILPFLTEDADIDSIYDQIFETYNDEYDGDDMFDAISPMLLMCYLEDRFHMSFEVETRSRWYVWDSPQKGTRYDTDTISDVSEVE